MNTAEFRALRNAAALQAMSTRLPILNAQIDAIYAELAPLFKELRAAKSKHEKEKVYARFDGRDWKWQNWCAERDNIVRSLALLKVASENERGYTVEK